MFNALEINQANLSQWFDEFEEIEGEELVKAIYLSEYLNVDMADIKDLIEDVMLYEGNILEYTDDYICDTGLLDSTPENLRWYFDAEAFGRDLLINGDVTEVEIMSKTYIASGV